MAIEFAWKGMAGDGGVPGMVPMGMGPAMTPMMGAPPGMAPGMPYNPYPQPGINGFSQPAYNPYPTVAGSPTYQGPPAF